MLASVTGPAHTVTNSYESGRDAMTSKTNAAASGTVSRFGAKYDALGRRIETSRSGSAFAQNFVSDYQYDLLGQLTEDERFAGATPGAPDQKLEEESFAFLYDGIGNRLTAQKGNDTTAYVPNALNQYTSIDGIEPVYDADGNLFSDGKNRFHWDAENRLTLVEPLVPTEGTKRLKFKYDYIGRRVSKQVWTHTGGSWTDTSTTAFVYDGWNLIEEVSTSSQTASINHYTWGLDLSLSLQGAGGVGGLLSVVCAPFTESGLIGDWPLPIGYVPLALSGVEGPAPSTFHYTFDLNGNVSEVLDATGSIAAHYEYGPFGELLRETYPSSALSEVERSLLTFNFSTKYHDSETGLLYYGYRYYDPSTGRWLNRDPIEESGGLNLYGFVGNDGVNRWDLLGMFVPRGAFRGDFSGIPQHGGRGDLRIPPGPPPTPEDRRREKIRSFNAWYEKEKDDMGWSDSLDDCPSKISVTGGDPCDCTKGKWGSLSEANETFHPGAKWCMRSGNSFGGAQQCCYDEDGDLITSGLGAGTPDRASASFWNWIYLGHYFHDVQPFQTAWDLDGGVLGRYLGRYLEVRPPNQGGGECY